MALSHFSMLIHELLNKDSYIVSEEAPLIIFYSKYTVHMAKNGEDNKHACHIARRITFVSNGERCKVHKIDWYD